jgi:hypothetical protein
VTAPAASPATAPATAPAGSREVGAAAPAAPSRRGLATLGVPPLPALAAAVLFAVLFARPLQLLARDWWDNPEAGHGLLLAPLALWFAWKSGIVEAPRPTACSAAPSSCSAWASAGWPTWPPSCS